MDIKTSCLLLRKALYGLVQASRQWWKKIMDALSKIGFKPTEADPCLFVKKGQGSKPPAFIILYVDGGGIFGTPEDIHAVLKALSNVFKVKNMGKMEHFVGCHLIEASGEVF
jgi:Reverse transcriptase (RNA-dependent DNA polymerase)